MLIRYEYYFLLLVMIFSFHVSVSSSSEQSKTLLRRTKREMIFPRGASVAIKWLITFPIPSVSKLATNLQFAHLIEIPLMRLYRDIADKNKGAKERNDVTVEDYISDEDFMQFLHNLQKNYMGVGHQMAPNEFQLRTSEILDEENEIMDWYNYKNNFKNETKVIEEEKLYLGHLKDLNILRQDDLRRRNEMLIIYKDFISFFEVFGLPGKPCLLHTICEFGAYPLTDSLVGEMLNMIMTPSLGGEAKLYPHDVTFNEYIEAEEKGRRSGECNDIYNKCTPSLFSILEHFLDRHGL